MLPRIEEVDALRGVAILLVTLAHTIVFPFDRFGVPLFVFISGLVLTYNYKDGLDLLSFLKKRVLFVGVPYLVWSAVLLFVFNPDNCLSSVGLSIQYYVNWTFTGNWQTLWFVYIIFQFYLLFPFLRRIYNTLSRELRLLLVVSSFGISLFSSALFKDTFLLNTPMHIFSWSFYFLFGMLFGSYWTDFIFYLRKASIGLLLTCAFGLFVFLNPFVEILYDSSYSCVYIIVGSVLSAMVSLFIFSNFNIILQVFRFLGKHSFALFLSQRPVIIASGMHGGFTLFVLIFVVGFSLSYGFSKLPFGRYVVGK